MFDPYKLSVRAENVTPRAAAAAGAGRRCRGRDRARWRPSRGRSRRRVVHDEHGRVLDDPYGPMRRYLFGLLRLAGEENEFKVEDKISSRLHNLPLMPMLCGDNCLTNVAPSKFLRLTDYQLFILKQWARGRFINEIDEGWLKDPPYNPFVPYPTTPPKTGRGLDRGVLSNALGGAFCPGAEVNWIMRNPSIYWAPYRIKADRSVSNFLVTAAQANTSTGMQMDYTFNVENPLSQDNNFDVGLQPGDMTKYMALPWQADFNECTTNPTDVTYADWNNIYPDSEHDTRMKQGPQGRRHHVVAGAPPAAIHAGRRRSARAAGQLPVAQLEQRRAADQCGRPEDGHRMGEPAVHHPQPLHPARADRAPHLPISPARRATSASSRTRAAEQQRSRPMSDNPFVGSWTYRSLLNDTDVNTDFNDLEFGRGTIVIKRGADAAAHRHDRRAGLVARAQGRARLRQPDERALPGQGHRRRRGVDLRLRGLAGAGLAERRAAGARDGRLDRAHHPAFGQCAEGQAAADQSRPASSPRGMP